MSKTVEIKKSLVIRLIVSVIVGFGTLFCLEHFGKFSYIASSTQSSDSKPAFVVYVDGNTPVSSIYYTTYFGAKIETRGNGFSVGDLNYADTEFNNYSTKLYYYTESLKKDYLYGVIISGIIFSFLWFFYNYKVKIV